MGEFSLDISVVTYPAFVKSDDDKAAYDIAHKAGWSEWVVNPSDLHAIREGCYFDIAAAERVRTFFHKHLRHATGEWAGKPFLLLEWEWRDVVAPIFGWRRANGHRRFQRGYLSCAKKNGKSGLFAGLELYLLLADGEAGAEVYTAAGDREQAALIYREAVKMIEVSGGLKRLCRFVDSIKTIFGPGRAFAKALSAEAFTKEGINASAVLFDELHAQPNRELWDTLRYAGSARSQPLLLSITTAGSDKETICGEQYEYAKRVISGEVADTSFYAKIYEADISDDWEAESTWHKANPSLGVTITVDKFRADLLEAKESPAKESSFRRYRLNQWVQTAEAWLSMDQWSKCDGAVDPKVLEGRECDGGLDLSATDDTTALVLGFDNVDAPGIILLPFFWLPEDNILNLERKHRVPYRAWEKQGFIKLTPGNVVDYDVVRADIEAIGKRFQIRHLAIDRKFQGQSLENDLIADGFDVVPAGQGWVSQDLPAKELERLLKAQWISHGGHPILKWHASNVVVDIDKSGNYSINKRKSRSKIDGIAATLMMMLCRMSGKIGG